MSILIPGEDPSDLRGVLYRDAARTAALIADGVNSLGDVAGSILVRGALWIAQRDPDPDHPYGHTKAESIAGLTVSVLIVFSALVLGAETLRSWNSAEAVVTWTAGLIGIFSALVKEALYWYTIGRAERLHSSSLRAVAWDHRSDSISSAAIGIALVLGAYVGPSGAVVDRIAALIMCIVLVAVGVKIYQRTARELMDQQASPELVAEISAIAAGTGEVCNVETLRVRKSGLEFFVEIHIEVDGQSTVEEGHRIGHEVKDQLLQRFPRIRDVHVHIEPNRD